MKITSSAQKFLAVAACIAGFATGHAWGHDHPQYAWFNLTSDIHGVAPNFDANLVNPWGLVPGEEAETIWVADNGTGFMTRYGLLGKPFTPSGASGPEVITVPPAGANTTGSPTGLVLDHAAFSTVKGVAANEFLLPAPDNKTVPSHLLIVTDDGEVSGFNPNSTAAQATPPSVTVMNTIAGADYKGAALAYVDTSATATPSSQHFLFAANSATGKIDVFANDFSQVTLGSGVFPGTFSDADAGYTAVNVKRYAHRDPLTKQTLRVLLVAYALIDPQNPPASGQGDGYITVFSLGTPDSVPAGNKVGRLVANVPENGLDNPWAMAIHRGATQTKDDLLVGNHGSGEIHVFSLNGVFANSVAPATDQGALLDGDNQPLNFSDLWALHFRDLKASLSAFAADDDELGGNDGTLFFSAGIVEGQDGLTGHIFKQP